MELNDGRTLGYAEWADPQGKPVLHFHGSGRSRLEHPSDKSMLEGVRPITADRPGHGLSDSQPGRRLLDWPDDVTAPADHLGLDRFAVSGWSFGGPYAMTCAHKIPERVTTAGLISSFAPYDRPRSTDGMDRFKSEPRFGALDALVAWEVMSEVAGPCSVPVLGTFGFSNK